VPITAQKQIVFDLDEDALKAQSGNSDRLVYSHYFAALVLQPPTNPDPDDVALLEQLLKSELGHLFLDRTRIRPKGFVLGEHLGSLSLAPGEEVVVEQKTFTKREAAYEDVSESERQFDLELSSTLSTELSEGLDRAQNHTEQTAFQSATSVGAEARATLFDIVDVGANVKQDLSFSQNVTDASSQTARRSIKDNATHSAKVASKYRAMHKTTFRVSTEDRFESTSKRVLRNPNPYSAIDLHSFKIMKRVELTQERFGVRMCWAPAVADPAAEVITRIELGRKTIIDRVMGALELPPRPPEPAKPNYPTRVETSAEKEADKWGVTGDMSADYDLPIDIPTGYVWIGDTAEVRLLSSVWGRPPENMGWYVVGTPWVADGKLWVRIHVGAGSWIGGPKVFMQARAKFVPKAADDDPEYKAAYQKWLGDVARWEADVAELRAAPMAHSRKPLHGRQRCWRR
jgi:hypothetical protein